MVNSSPRKTSQFQRLDPRLRREFEPLLGQDLSRIRIQVESDLPVQISARACADGDHLYFAPGEYQPSTDSGRLLIAHELAHAIQRQLAEEQPARPKGNPRFSATGAVDDPIEIEADEVATDLVNGRVCQAISPDRKRLVRRVVTPVRGSATLTIPTRPGASVPVTAPVGSSGIVRFPTTSIQANGGAQLQGSPPGDTPAGWTLGFLQSEYIETNWVHYRGQQNNHGSLLLQRGKSPSRGTPSCRDSVAAVNQVWYNPASNGTTAAFATPIAATFFDRPSDSANLVETNGITGQPNFLREIQLGFMFCCVLSLQSPTGDWTHLKYFYWNVRWQYQFTCLNFAAPNSSASWRLRSITRDANVSRVFSGRPTDARFSSILTLTAPAIGPPVAGTPSQTCNSMVGTAYAAVAAGQPGRRESAVWANFAVGR